tara:strand:- start:574 stop:2235 length:1662 start_codon:yes stop_codon:yes gene_type:complete
MGRSITQKSDLARYGVAELVDLTGVPVFYDAGTSKWLRTGQFTPVSNLTAETISNFGSASVSNILLSNLDLPYTVPNWEPPPYNSAGNVVCVTDGRYIAQIKVVTINTDGIQTIPTGQTSGLIGNAMYGTNSQVTGDGTYFYSWTFQSSAIMTMSRSTDGITWSSQSMTGLPTFAQTNPSRVVASGTGTNTGVGPMWRNPLGERWDQQNSNIFQWYFCGVKHLVIASGSTNQTASLSSDGISWSGDNTVAVLGPAVIPKVQYNKWWFWRNGNSCFLFTPSTTLAQSCRYTTDGGATWANASGSIPVSTSTRYFGYSSTNASHLYQINTTNTQLKISLDHGATWSAVALPVIPYTTPTAYGYKGGFVWKGTTMLMMVSGGDTYRSVDNGANWVIVIQPPSITAWNAIYCDGTNFYVNNNSQIFISTDGITWLTRDGGGTNLTQGSGVARFDANNLVMFAAQSCSYSTDAGVTWKGAQINVQLTAGGILGQHPFITPSLGATGKVLLGGRGANYANPGRLRGVSESNLTDGGAEAKNGSTVTPLQTGATTYTRVE